MQLSQEQKTDLRNRVLAGERLDLATCKAVVDALKAGRTSAAELAAKSGRKPSTRKKGMTDDELLGDIDSTLNLGNDQTSGGDGISI